MNILFLSELFHPHGGGAELATSLYAELLSQKGFNVVVITNRFDGESEVSRSKNLTIFRLPNLVNSDSIKYKVLTRVDTLLSNLVQKSMKWADVIYIPRFWYSAIPLAKMKRKPIVVHLHDYIPVCPLSNLFNVAKNEICEKNSPNSCSRCIYAWEKVRGRRFSSAFYSIVLNSTVGTLLGKSVRLSDAIVCVSRIQREIVLKADPCLEKKIHVIYNPLPSVHPVDIQEHNFGYFGGTNYLKGFQTLGCALRIINRNRSKGIRVYATGFTNLDDPSLRPFRNVGFIFQKRLNVIELQGLYEKIRAVIVPSIFNETFSYAVLEGLLNRRIVIASRTGAIGEVSQGCEGVFLFPRGEVNQLADIILYVANLSKERAINLGERNRERILQRFSNEKSINMFMHLINEVKRG